MTPLSLLLLALLQLITPTLLHGFDILDVTEFGAKGDGLSGKENKTDLPYVHLICLIRGAAMSMAARMNDGQFRLELEEGKPKQCATIESMNILTTRVVS